MTLDDATTVDPAPTRIVRLAVGVTLALVVSQAFNWDLSFVAPALAATLLALPLPAPGFKGGIAFVLVMLVASLLGLLSLLSILHQPAAGVLIVSLTVFAIYRFTAGGGPQVVGTFFLIGVLVVPAIGSESIDLAIDISEALALNAAVAVAFVWVAHALFPEPEMPAAVPSAGTPTPVPPSPAEVTHRAFRATLIVLPVFLWYLTASATAGYVPLLLKVATMGQQACGESARTAGRDLVLSTLVGGFAGCVLWALLKIWPALLIYGLIVLLMGLLFGRKIFAGCTFAPRGAAWSHAFVTMIIVAVPVMHDSLTGDDIDERFVKRLTMFLIATLYAVVAVYVHERFRPFSPSFPPRFPPISGDPRPDLAAQNEAMTRGRSSRSIRSAECET